MARNIGRSCIHRLCVGLIIFLTLLNLTNLAAAASREAGRSITILYYSTKPMRLLAIGPKDLCPNSNCLTFKRSTDLNIVMNMLIMTYLLKSENFGENPTQNFALFFSPHYDLPDLFQTLPLPDFVMKTEEEQNHPQILETETQNALIKQVSQSPETDTLFSLVLNYICVEKSLPTCLELNLGPSPPRKNPPLARFGRKFSRLLAAGTKLAPKTPASTAFLTLAETSRNYFDHKETSQSIAGSDARVALAQELIASSGLEGGDFQIDSHNQTVLTALYNSQTSSKVSSAFDNAILSMVEIGSFDGLMNAAVANPILIAGPGQVLSHVLGSLSLLRKSRKLWTACSKLHNVRSISCALNQRIQHGPPPLYLWLVYTSVLANSKSLGTQTLKCSVAAVNFASSVISTICVPGLGLLVTELTSSSIGFLLELAPLLSNSGEDISPLQQAFLDTYRDDALSAPSPVLASMMDDQTNLIIIRQAIIAKLVQNDPYLLTFIVLSKLKEVENGDFQMRDVLLDLGLSPSSVKEFTAFAIVLGPRSLWAADRVLEALAIR